MQAALSSVARCVSSLLGPARRLKYGEATELADDALKVLGMLDFQHPSATLLVEACEGQHAEYACGSAVLVCLTADLAAALPRYHRTSELRAWLDGVREAMLHACTVLEELAIPLQLTALPGAQSSMGAPPLAPADWAALCAALAHGRPNEMALAARCAILLGRPPWKLPAAVAVQRLGGLPAARSAVWRGVLLPLTRNHALAAQSVLLTPKGGEESRAAASDAHSTRREHSLSSFRASCVVVGADVLADDAGDLERKGEMSAAHVQWLGSGRGQAPLASTAGVARLSAALRRAGVRLVLATGATNARAECWLADHGVLLLGNLPPAFVQPLCVSAGAALVRDVRAMLHADASGFVDEHRLRVHGALLQGGTTSAAHGEEGVWGAGSGGGHYYLHLRAVPTTSAPADDSGGSGSSSGSSGSGGVVLLVCGPTEDAAAVSACHVRRCLHRLHAALGASGARWLPGAGAAEAACAARLEEQAALLAASPPRNVPPHTQADAPPPHGPWLPPPARSTVLGTREALRHALRVEAFELVSAALRRQLHTRARNLGGTTAGVEAAVAASVQRWRRLPLAEASRRLCAHDPLAAQSDRSSRGAGGLSASLWRSGAAFAPLLEWSDALGSGGGDDAGSGGGGPVLDLLAAKVGVLKASADALEHVLMTDVVVANERPPSVRR